MRRRPWLSSRKDLQSWIALDDVVYNKEVPPEKDLVVEESALIIIVNMYITRTCQYYGFSKKSNPTTTFTYLKIKE